MRAGTLAVRRRKFAGEAVLDREEFGRELQTILDGVSKFLTAEFELFSIIPQQSSTPADSARPTLRTQIRYDLVATGPDFHREERVGLWELDWSVVPGSEVSVSVWRAREETWSRASDPIFSDITSQAFAGVGSYAKQLMRGTDYWRTVLDGACGIEVYGNNGLAVGDIDGDGFDDLYICQPGGLPNRLYHNRGDGTFEDVTEETGAGVLDDTTCALFADFDNDGRQELLAVTVSGPLLFAPETGSRLKLLPDAFHFAEPPRGTFTSAAVADYDRDGWLDVFFCVYSYYQGLDQYQYPVPYYDAENGPPNFLFRNTGRGNFEDVTHASRMDQNNCRYSFACSWCDYDGDGWPDLYVANDFGRKNLYHNNADGTFTDLASALGVEDFGAGMSVCWFDYNNDQKPDLYVANMWTAAGQRITEQPVFMTHAAKPVRALYRKHTMGNSLLQNFGAGGFKDVTREAGVGMGRWAWASDSWDFDQDGYPDLYIANGMISGPRKFDLSSFFWRQVVSRSPSTPLPSVPYERGWDAINELIRSDGTWSGYQRNTLYLNNRDGTFSDVSGCVGLDLPEDSRAFALADLDHDGRLEFILKNRTAPQLQILRNQLADAGQAIAFRLRGRQSNRDAIGARVSINTGSQVQMKSVQAGSGFLSQHTKELFFGLGGFRGQVSATIGWPSGTVQHFQHLPVNHRIQIEEGFDQFRTFPFQVGARRAVPLRSSVADIPSGSYETWLVAPLPAPEFSLPDLAGARHSLTTVRGKRVLLAFWSATCPQSVRQLSLMKDCSARWSKLGLNILALNMDEARDVPQSRALVRNLALPFPVLFATPEVAAVYDLAHRYLFDRHRDLAMPMAMLLDEAGYIVKIYEGPLSPAHVTEDCRQIPQNVTSRLEKALPFPGTYFSGLPGRNLLTYAVAFFERGYLDEAAAWCRITVKSDPSSAEAEYFLGAVLLKQGKDDAAREHFERALRLRPLYPGTEPDTWNNLGLIAGRQGNLQEAKSDFEKALRLNPNHTIALENLGNVYSELRRWDEARALFERAIQNSPDDPAATYSLAMIYANQGDDQKAYQLLKKTLRLKGDYPPALNNLAVLLLRTGRAAQAIPLLEKCLQVAPDFDQPYLNLARIYAAEGKQTDAEDVLRQLLSKFPGHLQARHMLEQLNHH